MRKACIALLLLCVMCFPFGGFAEETAPPPKIAYIGTYHTLPGYALWMYLPTEWQQQDDEDSFLVFSDEDGLQYMIVDVLEETGDDAAYFVDMLAASEGITGIETMKTTDGPMFVMYRVEDSNLYCAIMLAADELAPLHFMFYPVQGDASIAIYKQILSSIETPDS